MKCFNSNVYELCHKHKNVSFGTYMKQFEILHARFMSSRYTSFFFLLLHPLVDIRPKYGATVSWVFLSHILLPGF